LNFDRLICGRFFAVFAAFGYHRSLIFLAGAVVLGASGAGSLFSDLDGLDNRSFIEISPSKDAPSDMDSLGVVICPSIRAVLSFS
jgi:hypothetical protein